MVRALVMLVVLAGAGAASADDDCTLSAEALRSQVDVKRLPKGAKVTEREKLAGSSRAYRETLVFADGLEATLGVGGCEHLGLSVALRSKKAITVALTPADAVALMKKALLRLPIAEHAALQPKIFLDALERLKAAPTAFPVALDCGEFTSCELALDTSGAKPTLLASYDFAL